MKIMIRILQKTVALAAIFSLPHLAFAAKSFSTMTPDFTTTNITPGIATTVANTITLVDGNGGSAVGNGSNCFYSVSVSPADPSLTTSLSVTNFVSQKNFPQTPTLVSVTFTALTSSNTYTVTVWANNNPSNSAAINPISTSFTITMLPFVFNPAKVWTNGGVDMNWSTAGNWSPSGTPGASNDMYFFDIGATNAAGAVDNVADTSLSIGSLNYGQTNGFHTTLIASGKSVTVVGANGLTAGTGTDNGTLVTVNTITGAGGTLVISNASATVNITQANPGGDSGGASAASATLDMSGLGVFNATISNLLVGVDSSLKGANGTLNLARTNIIRLTPGSLSPQIDVGDNSQSQGVTGIALSTLLLGQTNAFYVDSITVGRGRVTLGGTMMFNSAFNSPTAYFRGTGGDSSRVETWNIGDGGTAKAASCHGTNDFSLGTVDALVDTMSVGLGSSGTTLGTGALIVNAGNLDVNTLNIGLTTTNITPGTGTVNMNGGSLEANISLALANGGGSGTLNVSTAMVSANNGIIAGGGVSTINLAASTLNVTNYNAVIGTSNSPVSSFAITNSTMTLAIQNGAPTISTTNLAVGGGPNTINVSAVPLMTNLPTQFQVIQYGISGGIATGDLTTFVLGTLPSVSPTAYAAYLSNNVANNSIDIVFTSGPLAPVLAWDGMVNGNWDTTSANWKPISGPDTVYIDTAFVTFDDTLKGTTSVNLTGTLEPGNLTVNNTLSNYVFAGTGKISGNVGLNKTGSGSLILDNSGVNDFSGGVAIGGGTLQIGNNDGNGNLPSGPVTDNGALVFNRSNASLAIPNIISGTGTLTQNGSGTLTLTATNTPFAGPITVLQGTLQPENPQAFGTNLLTGSITITNAATLDVNGQKFGAGDALPVTVSGAGVGGNGAIVNNATNQSSVLHVVTLAADATFGGAYNWDIRTSGNATTNQDAQLNGAFNLTKVGTNTITLTGVQVDPTLKNINVQAGTLDVANMTTSLGDPNATATVFTNATLVLDTLSNVVNKVIILNDGATLKGSSTNYFGGPVILAGPLTLAGDGTITANSGTLFLLQNVIGGSGSLTKSGSGVVFLANADNYSGGTVVSGGTLALTNYNAIDGSVNSTTNINVTSGATLDVSGRSNHTLTLASGQTLAGGVGTNGPGTLNGILVANAGATVSPGTGTTNVGTLNVISNATLNGSIVMKISAAGGNDQVVAYGITYGGSLTVTNFSGLITNGQTFKLFVATNGNYSAGTFSGGVTLPSAPGLSWTNNLAVNGSISAAVVAVPPTQPTVTSFSFLSATQLVMSGTSSTTNLLYTYTVLSSTNVGQALSQWTTNSTGNPFNPGGNFRITNSVDPNGPQSFYILRVP